MVKKKKSFNSGIQSKKYFKSPLFLVIAILVTLIPIAIVARILMSGVGIVLLLGLIFSVISAIYAWIVFAGKTEIKNVKKFCRIMSYTRFLSTLVTIAFITLASVLVVGLLAGAITQSSGLYNIADTMEYEIKPFLQGSSAEIDEYITENSDLFTSEVFMKRGFWLGVNDIDDLRIWMKRLFVVASNVAIMLDDAIALARSNFAVFAIVVTAICGLVATGMCFVNSAHKNAVKQLQILSIGVDGFKRSHGFALYAGGTVLVIVGLVMFFFDPVLAAVPLLQGAVLYVLAMIFADVKDDKADEAKSFEEANEIAEAAKITVTDY